MLLLVFNIIKNVVYKESNGQEDSSSNYYHQFAESNFEHFEKMNVLWSSIIAPPESLTQKSMGFNFFIFL